MCDVNPRPGEWKVQVRTITQPASPEAIYMSLYSDRDIDSFWLDSARAAYGMGRYSVMGAAVEQRDHRVSYSSALREVRCSVTGLIAENVDIWEWLAHRVSINPCQPSSVHLPFVGGYVGYMGYGAPGGTASVRVDPSARDAEFLNVSRYMVFDHESGDMHIVSVGPEDESASAEEWAEKMVTRLQAISEPSALDDVVQFGSAEASVDRSRYLRDLAQVREWLLSGESYEACYTYNLRFSTREAPFLTYRRLRHSNPSPYAAFLRFGTRQVMSCSPERYLLANSAGWVETKPIKGTAARLADEKADEVVSRALALDPKTRSENLMIVDLLRNDLGLVCSPGTVSVPKLMSVESYATVHQLVSSVRGRLLPLEAAAVWGARALFPPGSMTGAPKVRTVAMLDRLEAAPRGVYSGFIGHFSRCGSADLSVVIRTAVVDGDMVSIGTGGAITVKSDPVAELEETIAKSSAILRAFGRAHPLDEKD
ncbi:aminodeoxychorismate synthase, component I [Clavibacter michiganensis]|nr:aminodeoxychorismate synthase, component I [Clavibacter michiganensis]